MRWIPGASALALAASLAASLVACGNPYPHPRSRGAGATEPRRGGILRYAISSDVRSLDPHMGYDEYSTALIRQIFDTLVDYAPGSTTLVPSLAERWDISSDGRVYTFHLRDGVRFHNGRPMVADDVRKSFERLLDPRAIPSPGAAFYHLLEGFDAFQAHSAPHVAGIVVLDPLTVQFRLTEPDPTFLNLMAMPFAAPVPVEEIARVGRDRFAQEPVGTGPFRLAVWESGARVVLARNPYYWRPGLPYLDGIVVDPSIGPQMQVMRFLRGDLENAHTGSLNTADYLWLHEQPGWRDYIADEPDISMYGLVMNTERPPWNNVHLRRAVAFAIDREAIARSRSHRIRALGGIYPPGLPGYDPNLPGAQHYDLAIARHEMALAGYPNGLPGEHELWLTEGPAGSIFGQLLQADLAQIGVHLRLHQASFAVYLENTQKRGAVELSLGGWSMDFPDPSNFVETLFATRSIQPENSQNSAFYSNPELDALLDRAHTTLDPEARLAMYREAERIVVRDAPWAFLYYPIRTEANQPYVRNFRQNPVFTHDFREVWLDLPVRPYALRDTRDPFGALSALAVTAGGAP